MERFKIFNTLWSYEVSVEDGIITDCSDMPNGRQHWCVGKSMEELRGYYIPIIGSKIDQFVNVTIEQI